MNKRIEELKDELKFEMYWDYNNELSDNELFKIITTEDGLYDVENELWENNLDYMSECEHEKFKEILTEEELEDEEFMEELRDYIEWDYNIEGLIKNSEIRLRLHIGEMMSVPDTTEEMLNDENIKQFLDRFDRAIDLDEFKREINNLCNDYGELVIYFKVCGLDILKFGQQYRKGELDLRSGVMFGLFNSWVGSGSLMECELKEDVKLNLRDWRIPNKKVEIVKELNQEVSNDYVVGVVRDSESRYGIDEVYGLTSEGWVEW